MTIIQIAGTSGSGKSHLVRAFLEWAAKENGAIPLKEFIEGRTAPIGYFVRIRNVLKSRGITKDIYIPGAYDAPTGGCDTIHNIAQVFDLVKKNYEEGRIVIFEGLFCMNQTRGPQLAGEVGKSFVVLQLTTPLAMCIASINERRAERGEGELVTKKNTIDNYKRAENYSLRMRDGGARVIKVNRNEALDKVLELLGGKQPCR